jgi:urease accessory protein
MPTIKRFTFFQLLPKRLAVTFLILICVLSTAQQAIAHHATGGNTPSNFLEGFLSGLAHPVIGLDHFAFVVAIGLLAAGQVFGVFIPTGFVLAALVGTGIHLFSFDLPATEMAIAVSVITFGAMLVMPNKPNWLVLTGLGAIAGLFHGYAYGESIIGAGMTPLFAYLLGFTLIQYAVALVALLIGNFVSQEASVQSLPLLRLAGLAICSIGVVFLTSSF